MHKELVNRLFKPAQEKVWQGERDRPAMTIAVDLGRKATKQTNKHAWSSTSKLKCITNAAFHIYALRDEDGAKRGGWRPCIK